MGTESTPFPCLFAFNTRGVGVSVRKINISAPPIRVTHIKGDDILSIVEPNVGNLNCCSLLVYLKARSRSLKSRLYYIKYLSGIRRTCGFFIYVYVQIEKVNQALIVFQVLHLPQW